MPESCRNQRLEVSGDRKAAEVKRKKSQERDAESKTNSEFSVILTCKFIKIRGGLVCCGPWGCKESNTTERLN